MRDDGEPLLFEEVYGFCVKNNIGVPNTDDLYQPRSWWKAQSMKMHIINYCVGLYHTVI